MPSIFIVSDEDAMEAQQNGDVHWAIEKSGTKNQQ